jgi:hypothetical protein
MPELATDAAWTSFSVPIPCSSYDSHEAGC